MKTLITPETGISLAVVSVVIGFVAWLTNLNSTSVANATQIEKVTVRVDRVDDNIREIMLDVKEIKTILKQKE